jgi:GNAT superfamily N-acetyltransferase
MSSTEHPDSEFVLEWRGSFSNHELNVLHAECFHHQLLGDDWWAQVNRYSLGWVCLRNFEKLVGFVNVAWDGGVHAFLLDTLVASDMRRQGYGQKIVEEAIRQARSMGCEWIHVDFEPHLRNFYVDACHFRLVDAGVIRLR